MQVLKSDLVATIVKIFRLANSSVILVFSRYEAYSNVLLILFDSMSNDFTYLEYCEPAGKLELSRKAYKPKEKNYNKSHVAILFKAYNIF